MASIADIHSLDEALRHCRDLDANVNERLACYAQAVRRFTPRFADAVDRLVERLSRSSAGDKSPMSGDPMPPFVLPDENGQRLSLDMLLTKGPVAVTFHRGHWCPYCRITSTRWCARQKEIAGAAVRSSRSFRSCRNSRQQFRSEAQAGFRSLPISTTDTRCRSTS